MTISKETCRVLCEQEMEDLVEGAIILGCGGGGNPDVARNMIRDVFSMGKEFALLDPKDFPDEAWLCILGYVGGGITAEEKVYVSGLERVWEHPLTRASKELAEFLGVRFEAYLPSEIGAGNTVANLFVAAMEGKPVVDGDAAGGRAKPELIISTTNMCGISPAPLAVTSHFGDVIIIKESVGDGRIEDLCRFLSRVSDGRVAVARCPVQGKRIKGAFLSYSISTAIELGRIVREARTGKAETVIEKLDGSKRFLGTIRTFSREQKSGFVWGDIYLEGSGDQKGHTYHLWFKNENLVAWMDEELDMTCPDSIILLDAETGKGIYNWGDDLYEGRELVAVGVKAAPIWKSNKGLEIFGPRHFGFDFEAKILGA